MSKLMQAAAIAYSVVDRLADRDDLEKHEAILYRTACSAFAGFIRMCGRDHEALAVMIYTKLGAKAQLQRHEAHLYATACDALSEYLADFETRLRDSLEDVTSDRVPNGE